MLARITLITIGQAPRSDLVPEIVAHLPKALEISEVGVLDDLTRTAVGDLLPAADDHALVTRMRDGRQVVIGKRWVQARLQELLDSRRPSRDEATVLLCTGSFPGLRAPGLFLDAQHLVDHGARALCGGAGSVGVLVPLGRQEGELHYRPSSGQRLRTANASPYEDADFEAAGRALAECDVLVMHCMGYTEAQREAVVRGSGRPVLLARRLVAAAMAQLV